MLGLFALAFGQAGATIVGGVRQKPVPETTGFATDTEAYLYNVGAQAFFTQGNSWGTQASIGETGLLMKFTSVSGKSGVYLLNDYFKDVNGDQQFKWKNAFFDSITMMFVDRNNQTDYYWEMEDNGNGTFRLMGSAENDNISNEIYPGMYVGLNVEENANNTALSPLLEPKTGHYIDWAMVSQEAYDNVQELLSIYLKAQELKAIIDKIEALNGNASSANAVYLDESSTIAQLEDAIEAANTAYMQAVIDNAPDKNNVDVTTLLTNPDFELGETGWTGFKTVAQVQWGNGSKNMPTTGGTSTNTCAEAFSSPEFDLFQTVGNAPLGVYEVSVQGFCRNGRGDNAWNNYANQTFYSQPGNFPVYVYLNTNQTPFVNVFSESQPAGTYTSINSGAEVYTKDGKDYPDGMVSSAIAFSKDMYVQKAYGLVANEGDVMRIGVKGHSTGLGGENDNWVIFDNFKVTYRGFQADVIKPVLESAVSEVSVYQDKPMGKTEYAALSKGLSDAAQAIADNNGEDMFAALKDLYAVKTSVQASVNLFGENGVNASITSLSEAISVAASQKMSATTLANANALLTGLQDNSIYENSNVTQIATDVNEQIDALNASIFLYDNLNNAITALQAETGAKASATVLSAANDVLSTATTAYNEGTIEDANVQAKIDELNAEKDKVTASAELYAQFYAAIGRLQDAVDEASAATAHVSQSMLAIANAQLTNATKVYNEGSIADDKIEARINSIDNIIQDLTKSINQYKLLNTAIGELSDAIDAVNGKKLNASVLDQANNLLTDATAGYNAGSLSDAEIEQMILNISEAKTALTDSSGKYETLADALSSLEPVKDLKANQAVTDEANTLYTVTLDAYNNGTIADDDIAAKVEEINDVISRMNTSAGKYSEFYTAIQNLEDAINDVSGETAHVSQSMLAIANAQLTNAKKVYNEGSIADDKIDARINSINSIIEDLTKSVNLYRNFADAIQDLKDEIDAMNGQKLSSATLASANAVYGYAKNDYDNGNVADEQVEARIAELRAMIETLRSSVAGYVSLAAAIESLENCITQAKQDNALSQTKVPQSVIDDAENLLNTTKADYEAGNVADANVAAVISSLEAMEQQLDEAVEVAQVTVTIGETGYATFFSAQPVSFVGTELKAFTATFNSDYSSVKLEEVTEIPANTPVIVQGAKGAYQLNVATAPATPDSNDLIVVEAGGSYATLFVLANKSLGVGFYKWTGTDLPVGKVALNVPAAARDFIGLEGDVTTGIMSAAWLNASGMTIYDLQGHKVDQVVKKGLYIVNGRKVVVK